MSEMRLRHKKPTNSYVGQANHDSNQAQDEDFIKNSMKYKKTGVVKSRPVNEQTKKYAEILYQFINVVNQDYRKHCALFPKPKAPVSSEEPKVDRNDQILNEKILKDNIKLKPKEVVSKQQQKIRVSEIANIKHSLPTKKIKKERPQIDQPPKAKHTQQIPPKNVIVHTLEKAPKQSTNFQKQKIQQQPPLPKLQQAAQQPQQQQTQIPQVQINNVDQMQQIQQMQQMFQNPYFSMNSGMYPIFPYGFPSIMNYPMYLEQLKNNNPFVQMQGVLGMGPQNLSNNYIPFSKLPFPRANQGMNPETKKNDKTPIKSEMNQFTNPQNFQPTKNSQGKPQTKVVQNPIPEKIKQPHPPQPLDFEKKSSYHVRIAYYIHFQNLKEKGVATGNSQSEQSMKMLDKLLDPTLAARNIKQRKNQDSGKNNQDFSG